MLALTTSIPLSNNIDTGYQSMSQTARLPLPHCATPRPGERVVYYRSESQYEGIFHGYDIHDQLLVQNSSGGITPIQNFMQIRLADPANREIGCWSSLPKSCCVQPATKEQIDQFSVILEQMIPPGIKYINLIDEIWARGYEVFLVGGTVRDVLNGGTPNDVDMVTTIPFFYLQAIAESMFGHLGFSRSQQNGFMSIGKNAGSRSKNPEVSIDIKNFFSHAPGTPDATFGSNLDMDYRLRDFSCNAVYYDPKSHIFLDPCGHGISDSMERVLNVVNDPELSHPVYRKAHIAMRFFKFVQRSYTPSTDCLEVILKRYKPLLDGIGSTQVQSLFFRSILNKLSDDKKAEAFWHSKQAMIDLGFADTWANHLKGLEAKFGGRS